MDSEGLLSGNRRIAWIALCFSLLTLTAPGNAQTVLIASNATWKYLDDGSDAGSSWTAPGFDDSAWASGAAELGYGDEDEQTVVNGGPAGNRFVTTYFRHTFQIADPSSIGELMLGLVRDDGAVVYLNGVEVWRSNMPCGPISAATLAASLVGGVDEAAFRQSVISAKSLAAGSNVLAVEVHQASVASTDVSFNLTLAAAAGSAPTPFPTPQPGVTRFAVIGDFGDAGLPELDVSQLVKSWHPELILTVGDNNYPVGSADTIDANIGQYYCQFIAPYSGCYGAGSPDGNRFFPSLGNHDWIAAGALPYLNYFTLPESSPGNERYYRFRRGPVDFFAIDSDPSEPDGVTSTSIQAQWLQQELTCSSAPWRVAYFHHPPYSSSNGHGSQVALQWPFASWGITAVFAGHDHVYERILFDGIVYFVNGLGGRDARYGFTTPVSGSVVRYNEDFGALLVEATDAQMQYRFINRTGTVIDSYTSKEPQPTCLVAPATSTPTASMTPSASATVTPSPSAIAPTATPADSATPTPSAPPVMLPVSGGPAGAVVLLILSAGLLSLPWRRAISRRLRTD